MPVTGYNNPTASKSSDRGSDKTSWSGANNTYSSNNSRASCVVSTPNNGSDYLVVSGFGFSVPAGVIITKVWLKIEGYSTDGMEQFQSALDTDVTTFTEAINGPVVYSTDTVDTYEEGSIGVTSANLTPAQVNASTFGIGIWFDDSGNEVYIDHIQLQIEYEYPGAHNGFWGNNF